MSVHPTHAGFPPPSSLALAAPGAFIPRTEADVKKAAQRAVKFRMIKRENLEVEKNGVIIKQMETDADLLERAEILIEQGASLGIPPHLAVASISLKDGKFLIHAEAGKALLLSRGFKLDSVEIGNEYEDHFKVVVTMTRPNGSVLVRDFSVADARREGIWQDEEFIEGKPNTAVWWTHPKRCMFARAFGYVFRDGATDVANGMYVREEWDDHLRSQLREGTSASQPAAPQVQPARPALQPPPMTALRAAMAAPVSTGQPPPATAAPAAPTVPAPAAPVTDPVASTAAEAAADPVLDERGNPLPVVDVDNERQEAEANIMTEIGAALRARPHEPDAVRTEFSKLIATLTEENRALVVSTIDAQITKRDRAAATGV